MIKLVRKTMQMIEFGMMAVSFALLMLLPNYRKGYRFLISQSWRPFAADSPPNAWFPQQTALMRPSFAVFQGRGETEKARRPFPPERVRYDKPSTDVQDWALPKRRKKNAEHGRCHSELARAQSVGNGSQERAQNGFLFYTGSPDSTQSASSSIDEVRSECN